MGAETVYNHADYRLASLRALDGLAEFGEVNLFLRGMFPLVGYRTDIVYYDREERIAGESHYPLSKMLALAVNGITSMSVRPIRLITGLGTLVAVASLVCLVAFLVARSGAVEVAASVVCLLVGLQILAQGVVGEYVGKVYLEAKARPRFIVAEEVGLSDAS